MFSCSILEVLDRIHVALEGLIWVGLMNLVVSLGSFIYRIYTRK